MHVLVLRCTLLAAAAAGAVGPSAAAYVTWFSSLPSWEAATLDESVAVTFDEPAWPVDQPLAGTWTVGGVSFTGFAGVPFPNVYVYSGTTEPPFGTGNWMTANGDEDIDIEPLGQPTALAFDATANAFGPATIRVFGPDDALIGTLVIPIGTTRFVGINSSVPIARVNFTSILGAIDNTGFDTIRIGERAVLLGDLDGDGQVNGADLGLLIASWGGAGSADLDCDGVVDGADLGLLISAWTG